MSTEEAAAPQADVPNGVQDAPQEPPQPKVIVKNLESDVDEDKIKGLFSGVGTVENVELIKRGEQSKGYGFVTFETVEIAEKAVSELHGKEVGERTIVVELVKAGRGARSRGSGRGRARGGRGRGGRGRSRGGLQDSKDRDAVDGNDDEQNEENPDADEGDAEDLGRGRGRGRGARGRGGRGRGGRFRPRGPPEGELSKTTVYVANLLYDVDDDQLRELFEGLNVTSAHVVKRKYGPAAGKSRGFGFVELASEDDQKKAVETINNKDFNGRPVHVKIGIAPSENKEDEEDAKEDSKDADNAGDA